ncbi:DUF7289 family protein [Halostella salina]|uniref:DUF7289 family protein n=1 Tax=Halostella salina TaxID=1547897 RepID=UPI000EF84080|nr:hypothetical protein [Halostella salina]
MTGSRRGQSEVLALVLLFGIVAVGAAGIMLVGGTAVSDMEQRSANEKSEQAFVELRQTLGTAARDQNQPQSVDLAVGKGGAVAREDTGWIRVESDALDDDLNVTIGTVEYSGTDGTKLAYQAGGVFRETGNATQVVSRPPIDYASSDSTLTFPVITVAGDETLGPGELQAVHESTTTYKEAAVLEDENVKITVKSDYYRGWEQYFRAQAGDPVVQEVDHEKNTVTVQFGYDELDQAFDAGMIHTPGGLDDFCTGKGCTIGDTARDGRMRPIDPVIHDIVNDTEDGTTDVDRDLGVVDTSYTGSDELSDGTYVADRIEGGDLEFDLSEGNATLVVDGDMDMGNVTVTDHADDHTLKIYTTGDLYMQGGGAICVEPCDENTDASVIQVYGTSEMGVDFGTGGSPRFEGLLYAASDESSWGDRAGQCDTDIQVCIQSNPSIYGSIVSATVDAHSSAAEFEYDESLAGEDIELYPGQYTLPPPITYVNINHHRVEVRDA